MSTQFLLAPSFLNHIFLFLFLTVFDLASGAVCESGEVNAGTSAFSPFAQWEKSRALWVVTTIAIVRPAPALLLRRACLYLIDLYAV